VLDNLKRGEARQQTVHHGAAERRHGRRTTDQQAPRLPGAVIQTANSADKIPPVGQVDIVAAAGQTGFSHTIVLLLEGTGGMDDQLWLQRRDRVCHARRGHVEHGQLCRRIPQRVAQRHEAGLPSAGECQMKTWVTNQLAGNARTEHAGGADQYDTQGHPFPLGNPWKNKTRQTAGSAET
jgi:hypothetical protein